MILQCHGCSVKYQVAPQTEKHIIKSFPEKVVPWYIKGHCATVGQRCAQYIIWTK